MRLISPCISSTSFFVLLVIAPIPFIQEQKGGVQASALLRAPPFSSSPPAAALLSSTPSSSKLNQEGKGVDGSWVDDDLFPFTSTFRSGASLSSKETEFFRQKDEERNPKTNEVNTLETEQHYLSLPHTVKDAFSSFNQKQTSLRRRLGSRNKASVQWESHSWMGDLLPLIGNNKITEILLPGTHNSGAYNLAVDSDKGAGTVPEELSEVLQKLIDIANVPSNDALYRFLARMSETQSMSIYKQLWLGARSLDIRAAWDDRTKSWRTFHGLFGLNIRQILMQILFFLRNHPREIVVLEITHFRGNPGHGEKKRMLRDMVIQIFGEMLVPIPPTGRILKDTPTIKELVQKNQRAFVTMEDDWLVSEMPGGGKLWTYSTLLENTYANTCDMPSMFAYNLGLSYVSKTRDLNSPVIPLLKISWTLTLAEISCVVPDMLTPGGKKSLLQWGGMANRDRRWKEFVALAKAQAQRSPGSRPANLGLGNIVAVDDLASSTVVTDLVNLNAQFGWKRSP